MHLRKPLLFLGCATVMSLGACAKKDAVVSDSTAMIIDSTALRNGTIMRDSLMIRDSIRLDSARRADSIRIVDTLGAKKTPPA